MASALLSPSRTVLLTGDDALYIYKVSNNASRLVETVSWQSDDFEEVAMRAIRRKCGRKPIMILNDMTDQHFKGGQRIPKVGVMDKQAVLERRLQMAFNNYPIRGALAMPTGRGEAAESLYLFAAVPMSEQIGKALSIVKNSLAPIAGFALLPVESASMVSALAAQLTPRGKEKSRWGIFMGQHESGALRQVIVRDGQLAMTRMTPILDDQSNPKAWASDVVQEFKSTLSYLSRFGFNPDEGVDVFVVAAAEAGDYVRDMIDISCNFTSFTVNEAARLLKVGLGLQQHPYYADSLHAAWAGRKLRFTMPMKVRELEAVERPRKIAMLASLGLLGAVGYFGYQSYSLMNAISAQQQSLLTQKRTFNEAQAELDGEIERLKGLGIDVQMVQAGTRTYKMLMATSPDPLMLIKKIGEGLGPELRIDKLRIDVIDAYVDPNNVEYDPYTGAPVEQIAKEVVATILMSAPATLDIDIAKRELAELERRLAAVLPDYKVTSPAEIGGMDYTQNVQGTIGPREGINLPDIVAEIEIRGILK